MIPPDVGYEWRIWITILEVERRVEEVEVLLHHPSSGGRGTVVVSNHEPQVVWLRSTCSL
jgi:hypothetical protein